MADRICDNCMSRVPAGAEQCPRCGIHFENTNPGGALPNGWVLGGRYTVGRYNDIDGEGVTYSAIDGVNLQRVAIKEFMPVTLCAAREENGAIRPKPGCEVLFKTTRMDFSDLHTQLLRMGQVEGLVQVLDVLEENNTAYVVLEKVEGPTLAEYLTKRAGAIEAARALALLRPVMNGVEALHAANLVHRGICPENIILESGGNAKLCGFGTLALRQQGSELKPKLYPGYSAPEQYAANEFEGRYTDIYALGAVLYRLVTGAPPQPADSRKLQDELRPARAKNREVPTFLSAAIARAMRLVPAERVQSVADLRLALVGEGSRESKGLLWGLTRQQLLIGGIALAAVVVLVLVILFVSMFTGGSKKPASSSLSQPTSISLPAFSFSQAEDMVPNFVGRKYSDVVEGSVWANTFTFAEPEEVYDPLVEAGRIISQTPAANTVWDGTPIQLVVSLGGEPVTLPNYVGKPLATVKAELVDKGFTVQETKVENNGEYEENAVVSTQPGEGATAIPGKTVIFISYAGPVNTIAMPNIAGETQANAEAVLNAQKIQYRIENVTNTDAVSKSGQVAATTPPAGYDVATGATIVTVQVYGNYVMPDLNTLYAGKSPAELTGFLAAKGVPYNSIATATVETSDPLLDGKIAVVTIPVGVGGQVTATSAPVSFTQYKYVPAPPASSGEGGTTP